MNKILFSVTLILIGIKSSGQMESKTIKWLTEHKNEIFLPRSYANGIIHGSEVIINEEGITLYSENLNLTTIGWKRIINVNDLDYGEYGEIEIVSGEKEESDYVRITLSIQDDNFRSKFFKVFKKIAKRRGAKFAPKVLLENGY